MRTKQEKIEKIQETLERHRRFDYEYIPFVGEWIDPDGEYEYRRRGFNRFMELFLRTAMRIFAPILLTVWYGARVDGKENLKAIGKSGAVCVCNHFNYLDTLFVRQAVGYFRSYHTMGPKNNKKGLGGWFMRNAGMLPFSPNLEAARNLNKEIGRLLEGGKIVNFYAEQALWTNYQKPRPMKDGAFHYALKHNVPVLPVFCSFRKNRRGWLKGLRIHILPAVYAGEGSKHEKLAAMKARAEEEWRECYEKSYGVPLEYL